MSETDEQFLDSMEQWVIGSLVFKREHRERLFALARRGAAVPWRPISEAPTDGTEVLVMIKPKKLRLGWYFKPSSTVFGWCDENSKRIHPTHFMPLPPPPSGEPRDE